MINWHKGQRVVCIFQFDSVFDGHTAKKPIVENIVYTVKEICTDEGSLKLALVLCGYWKTVECENTKLMYDAEGFMPLDLWLKNAMAVNQLMEEIL